MGFFIFLYLKIFKNFHNILAYFVSNELNQSDWREFIGNINGKEFLIWIYLIKVRYYLWGRVTDVWINKRDFFVKNLTPLIYLAIQVFVSKI